VNSILAFAPVFEDEETNKLVATKERSVEEFNEQLEATWTFLRAGGRISTLPGTEMEVQAIDELYESKGGTSKFFLHKEANEEQIKQMDLSQYSYLHFATHGIVNENNPQLSGLISVTRRAKQRRLYSLLRRSIQSGIKCWTGHLIGLWNGIG